MSTPASMSTAARVLILYASANGQTRKIAERIGAELRERGLVVEAHDLDKLPEGLAVADWEGVLLGASIHAGKHLEAAVDFARHHRPQLESLPSAFFSVSLAAADHDEESVAATREYLDGFVEATGWQPRLRASFAGAILYSHYGFFERTLMKLIMRHKGHGDIKWDQEFTDWEAVDAFANEFAGVLAAEPAHR